MKNFIIKIKYSWGEEEEPIFIQRYNKDDAFNHMIDLAIQELKVTISEHKEDISINIAPEYYDIVLNYGYDEQLCYYRLIEEK